MEYFDEKGDSSDPFYLRPGKEACTISDATLPDHSIFLLRAGQNFRLRIRHEYNASSIPSAFRISAVYARVDEDEYVKLDTEVTMGQRRSLEVVALVEPARLQSPRLLIPALAGEGLGEKYVKLDVAIDAVLNDDERCVERRQHVIYCKVFSRTCRLISGRLRSKRGDAWHLGHP